LGALLCLSGRPSGLLPNLLVIARVFRGTASDERNREERLNGDCCADSVVHGYY